MLILILRLAITCQKLWQGAPFNGSIVTSLPALIPSLKKTLLTVKNSIFISSHKLKLSTYHTSYSNFCSHEIAFLPFTCAHKSSPASPHAASPAYRNRAEGIVPAKAEVPPGSYPPSVHLSAEEAHQWTKSVPPFATIKRQNKIQKAFEDVIVHFLI